MNVEAAFTAYANFCHFDRREKSPWIREISPFGRDDNYIFSIRGKSRFYKTE